MKRRLIDAESLSNLFLNMQHSGNTCDPQDVLKAIANAPTVGQDSEPVLWEVFSMKGSAPPPYFTKTKPALLPDMYAKEYYTSPPKREWGGLSEEDLLECMDYGKNYIPSKIEAKLKEVNGYD